VPYGAIQPAAGWHASAVLAGEVISLAILMALWQSLTGQP
jgi:hypothetical protein